VYSLALAVDGRVDFLVDGVLRRSWVEPAPR
jgi:hypothetical protein